jgi:predicted kinase
MTEENLNLGNSVLLDVPHVKEVQLRSWRRSITGLANKSRAKMVVIKCSCSETVLKARLRRRGEKRDHWKLNHWEAFLRQQPIDVRIPFDHLSLNTEEDLSTNVRAAVRYIVSGVQPRHKS